MAEQLNPREQVQFFCQPFWIRLMNRSPSWQVPLRIQHRLPQRGLDFLGELGRPPDPVMGRDPCPENERIVNKARRKHGEPMRWNSRVTLWNYHSFLLLPLLLAFRLPHRCLHRCLRQALLKKQHEYAVELVPKRGKTYSHCSGRPS